LGFRVWASGCTVWGFGFGLQGVEFGFRVWASGCRVWGFGGGVQGVEFWV